MNAVRDLIAMVAPKSATVMVTGPSGTGKELIAKTIHGLSPRKTQNFVAVNCGAIPDNLLESELFGHEKGAFTGALTKRIGRFEQADGGTIFLDEIGDMPYDMQVKLLRVLEERKIERVGGHTPIDVNVRVICATHQNLDKSIREGKFREDLFHRLNVFPIEMASLATRRDDIPLLIQEFFKRFMDEHDARGTQFDATGLTEMQAYDWPGNIRELRNAVERACIMFAGKAITAKDVQTGILRGKRSAQQQATERDTLWDMAGELTDLNPNTATTDHLQNFDPTDWVNDGTADDINGGAESETAPQPIAQNTPNTNINEPDPLNETLGDLTETLTDFANPTPEPTGGSDFFAQGEDTKLKDYLATIEKDAITKAVAKSDGSVSAAAKLLGLQRTTLIEKMKKYGLS